MLSDNSFDTEICYFEIKYSNHLLITNNMHANTLIWVHLAALACDYDVHLYDCFDNSLIGDPDESFIKSYRGTCVQSLNSFF